MLRAQAIGEMHGLMKILVGANYRILGFTMIGSEAGEVMAVVQTAIIGGMPYTRLRDAVLAHPTMAKGLGFLLGTVPARNVQPTMRKPQWYRGLLCRASSRCRSIVRQNTLPRQ